MNRVRYFDSLRLVAMFIGCLSHFVDEFHPEYFDLLNTYPISLIFGGLSGKVGLVLLGLLLGYFAYLSKDENATRYILKRYAFFVFTGLLVNFLYALHVLAQYGYMRISIIKVIFESITIDDGIFNTFWCIPVFFAASAISYLNGRAKVSTLGILVEIFIFFKMQCIWLAVCLMGNLIARYKLNPHHDILKYRVVRIVLWVVMFLLSVRPESNMTYMIHGICFTVMVMLIMRGTVIQKLLNNKLLSFMGQQAMGILGLHMLCFTYFSPVIFRILSFLPYDAAFVLNYLITFGITTLLAVPSMKFINTATNYTGKLIERVLDFEAAAGAGSK